MQVWRTMWPQGGVWPWEALWRALRGIYVGEVAETRAARWWSRRDRETARESLRLIELRAQDATLENMIVVASNGIARFVWRP
jgi:hypothetical protein